MKKKFLILSILLLFTFMFIKSVSADQVSIEYQTHIQKIGWQNYVSENQMAGTTGRSLRLEAIKIKLGSDIEGSIKYQTHIQNIGWQNWVENDKMSGTEGRSLRLEAIKIELTGELKEKYDIYYQVHIEKIGWQDWVKNGVMAGTTGRSLRLEAIRIKLIPKTTKTILTYKSYVEGGWQSDVKDNEISGTEGESKKIEAFIINFDNYTDYKGDINYSIYTEKDGWGNYVSSGTQVGKQGSHIEAIKIKLTEELAEKYNIFYRTHISGIGWLGWTSNDKISGNIGYFKNIEAIQIRLEEKDLTTTKDESNSYIEYKNVVLISSHVQKKGWMEYVGDNQVSGSTGESLRLEAFKIKIDTKLDYKIEYSSYVELIGWQNFVSNDSISGTIGRSKRLEAIQIKISGELSEYYDIYYTAHISNIGWMDWAKNGEKLGSIGSDSRIEAIKVKLVVKGNPAPGATSKKYVTGKWSGNYYYDYFGKKVTGFRFIDGVKYYFDPDGEKLGENVKKVIDVSYAQGFNINWDTIKNDGDIDAAILRIGYGAFDENDPEGAVEDSKFKRNLDEVRRLNIPYSVYIFGYANKETGSVIEAEFIDATFKKYNIPKDIFIWYDAELNYSRDIYSKVVPKFVDTMKAKGYNNVGVYSNYYRFVSSSGGLNNSVIRSYPIWVAEYNDGYDDYPGEHYGLQYTSSGVVNGVPGVVDISVFYK